MRETPGTCDQLRAALSVPEVRMHADAPFLDAAVDTLWQWLDLLAEP